MIHPFNNIAYTAMHCRRSACHTAIYEQNTDGHQLGGDRVGTASSGLPGQSGFDRHGAVGSISKLPSASTMTEMNIPTLRENLRSGELMMAG